MIRNFTYQAFPARVVFGGGTISQVRAEVERLGGRCAIVLSTPGRGRHLAEDVATHLGPVGTGVCALAVKSVRWNL